MKPHVAAKTWLLPAAVWLGLGGCGGAGQVADGPNIVLITLDTLRAFGRDPKHLGGELGVTAILHTWGQTLAQHLHLHCVVTGGALSRDGARFVVARPGFLFPVLARHPLPVKPMGTFLQQLALPLADLVRMHSVSAGQLIEGLLLFGRFQRQSELERA